MTMAEMGEVILKSAGVASIKQDDVTVHLPRELVVAAVDAYLKEVVRGQTIIEINADGIITRGSNEFNTLQALGIDTEGITRKVAG